MERKKPHTYRENGEEESNEEKQRSIPTVTFGSHLKKLFSSPGTDFSVK